MADTTFIRKHLAEAETGLKNLKLQKSAIEREIAALEQVVQLEREAIVRQDAHQYPIEPVTPKSSHAPRAGSKRGRIIAAIKEMLIDHKNLHRLKILELLEQRGLVGGQSNPAAYVSNILSTANGAFVSDNNGTWSLPPVKNMGKEGVMSE
jgi:hypothetical protein